MNGLQSLQTPVFTHSKLSALCVAVIPRGCNLATVNGRYCVSCGRRLVTVAMDGCQDDAG